MYSDLNKHSLVSQDFLNFGMISGKMPLFLIKEIALEIKFKNENRINVFFFLLFFLTTAVIVNMVKV